MPDLVTLRQIRAKAYDKMEAVLAAEESETRQADFDAAAAEVEALDKEIANAERLQKLRGERARGTSESEGLDSVPAQGFMAKYRNLRRPITRFRAARPSAWRSGLRSATCCLRSCAPPITAVSTSG